MNLFLPLFSIPSSSFDLTVTGLEVDKNILVNMIEMEANEITEDIVLKAFKFCQPFLKKQIDFQKQITKEIGQAKIEVAPLIQDFELEKEIKEFLNDSLEKYIYEENKIDRKQELANLKEKLIDYIEKKYSDITKVN